MKKLLITLVLMTGCATTVPQYYLTADRETYKAVSKDLREYYAKDTKLSDEDRNTKLFTLDTWKMRLDHYEGISSDSTATITSK